MNISCAIIDDEPLAAGLLEGYVKKTPYLNLVGTYNSAVKAMKDLSEKAVQVVFLDIQMPELNGIEFSKVLPKDTKIIFTTAFPQYALDSFKANVLDYLLKPISYENFLNAADKAFDWFTLKIKKETYLRDRYVFVKSDYKLVRIDFDDLLFAEGLKDYIRFNMRNGDTIMTLMSMKRLELYLPYPEFMRVHRSYMVHMPDISVFERFRIIIGEETIPISEHYKPRLQEYMDLHTIG
jgi:DNA-binding LytR/AlgR family response regulator